MTLRIGIDLGGTKIEGIVMAPSGEILLRERRPTPTTEGYDAIVDAVQALAIDLEHQVGQTCTVGIGTPGALSSRDGNLKNSNTVCMNGRPLLDDLQRGLCKQVRMENDANCFALSEAIDGAGREHRLVFGVIMGTGVGGGIVCEQSLHSGPQHIAGEWGHNVLDADGPECYCGKRGCVETFISGPGLLHLWQDAGGDKSLTSLEIVHNSVADPLAEQVMAEYHDRFGQALAMVINILDPDVIVLGGGMSNIQSLYSNGRDAVRTHVFNDELKTLIVPNQHGDSSGVRGAAQLWPA
jgi:fructokinase